MRAVELAGGLPVVLPPLGHDTIAPLLDRLDGVCLSGGPDLDPAGYGADERSPELGTTEPELDAYELALAQLADARGVPVLGICRGSQALNVARGGTLHQHVGDLVDGSVEHRQAARGRVPTHAVRIEPGSRLAQRHGRHRGRGQLLPPPGRRPARAGSARRSRGRRTVSSRASKARARRSISACSGTRSRSSSGRSTSPCSASWSSRPAPTRAAADRGERHERRALGRLEHGRPPRRRGRSASRRR